MRRSGNTFAPGSSLFSPSIVRGLTGELASISNVTAASLSSSVQNITQSFRYDSPGSPIKSTQQLPIDWSKFENHTFFNSAEAKVNTAFELIINSYPFDGSKTELLEFFDALTGYEKYVFDRFPKSLGFLHFENGSYVKVNDIAGAQAPSLSRNSSAKSVLDQGSGPITYDVHLRVPSNVTQGNQVVIQRLSGNQYGITLALSSTLSSDVSGTLLMLVSSGTAYMSASMPVAKGDFQHVCATYDATPGVNKIKMFRNAVLESSSSSRELGGFGYTSAPLLIGSGVNHAAGFFGSVTPGINFGQTLSGTIDELRVYHSARSASEQKKFIDRSVYSDSNLKLYYKFNEPTGSFSANTTIIDSSGNSLHSVVTNFTESLRERRGISLPMLYESNTESPVLFPSYQDVITLNEDLLTSASDYDANNPNMITKLIPRHYLQEASIFEGFGQNSELGTITDTYGSNQNFPGGGKLGSAQIIATLLFVWAKHFDEIKMHLDQFGKQRNISPVEPGTIASTFLPQLAESYGISLPEMFPNASFEQFYDGKAITNQGLISENSLQYVQNQIWRRILSDMVEITRTKGTVHSIKSLIRNMGLNPDSNFRFKEFGGSRAGTLADQRIKKTRVLRSLDFSGSFTLGAAATDVQGIPTGRPYFKSSGLIQSGSMRVADLSTVVRREPGLPYTGSTPMFDRILTSGSWSYEGTYKFTPPAVLGVNHPKASSLVRFFTSGTDWQTGLKDSLYLNLIAYASSSLTATGSLKLVFRDTWSTTQPAKLEIPLTGVNVYDGDPWHISFGRIRNDLTQSYASSSWFLRAGKQSGGRIENYYENEVYFDDSVPVSSLTGSVLSTWSAKLNMSGTMIHIGSQSVPKSINQFGLSYNGSPTIEEDRTSFFGGRVLNMRFWSKGLSKKETFDHILNPTSLGSDNAKTKFNFVSTVSGSWEKLRLDVDFMQEKTQTDTVGAAYFTDMSQNGLTCTGSGFEPSAQIFRSENITFSTVSPFFDQSTDSNKIRVRSWLSDDNVSKYGGVKAPLNSIPEDEEPVDDIRFGVEVSAVQALNEDITKIFSSLDSFDNYIGRPELQFSEDYPDLQALRDVYFNRLTDQVNFKTFFEFFKWFDTTVSQLIENLIPRRTKFMGVNFVVEPHMLERPKIRYNTFDLYLGPNNRNSGLGQILVQQLVGVIKRY